MISKTSVNINKPINLILVSIFYEIFLYCISVYIKIQEFTIETLKASLVFLYDSKWFIGIYVILFCLIPYLNIIVNKLDKTKYRQLIIILFIWSSVIPTIFTKVRFNDNGYGIFSFIMLYFIGGYLRLHYKADKNKFIYLSIYLLCSIITALFKINDIKINSGSPWWNYNSMLNVLSTIALFLFFIKINIHSKTINYLSTYSFVIYIIYSDISIRTFLYRKIFKSEIYWNHQHMILNMIKTIIGIYILCVLIDMIRRIIIKPFENRCNFLGKLQISI